MPTFKFTGMKNDWDKTSRLIAEGSVSKPVRYADKGGTLELTDDEAKELRAQGFKLSESSEDQTQAEKDEEAKSGEAETRAQQQAAQVASGAQHAAATQTKDNTPAGREAKGNK